MVELTGPVKRAGLEKTLKMFSLSIQIKDGRLVLMVLLFTQQTEELIGIVKQVVQLNLFTEFILKTLTKDGLSVIMEQFSILQMVEQTGTAR